MQRSTLVRASGGGAGHGTAAGASANGGGLALEADQFVNDFQVLVDQLNRENEELDEKLRAEEDEIAGLKRELEHVQNELNLSEKGYGDVVAKRGILDSKLERADAEVAEAKKKISGLEFKIQESSKVLKSVEDESAHIGDEYTLRLLRLQEKGALIKDIVTTRGFDQEALRLRHELLKGNVSLLQDQSQA